MLFLIRIMTVYLASLLNINKSNSITNKSLHSFCLIAFNSDNSYIRFRFHTLYSYKIFHWQLFIIPVMSMYFFCPVWIPFLWLQVTTQDGGILSVGADIQFRIWNPVMSVVSVQDLNASTRMTAQNALIYSLAKKTVREIQTERVKLGEYLGVRLCIPISLEYRYLTSGPVVTLFLGLHRWI